MRRQKLSQISGVLGLCLLLAACTSEQEPIYLTTPPGTVTLAPKKATSRPYEIKGVWYYPQLHYEYEEVGVASFYGGGDVFHGRPTATGEIFDLNGITAAHKTLPLPCMAEVTNLENGRQINVKVNDRGPFPPGRMIDVSRRVAQLLGFEGKGLAQVRVRTLVPESLALNGLNPTQTMLAAAPPPPLPVTPPPPVPMPFPDMIDKIAAPTTLAAAPAASPAKPTAPLSTGIFVDVGAYKTLDEAKVLSKLLANVAESPIQPVQHTGPTPYAVRVGPLASMSTANQVLDQLLEAGHHTSRITIHR